MNFLRCLCALLCLLSGFSDAANAAGAKRPNILFILVDDQSPWDFKFYNPKSELRSPNLDRLAAEGMVFDGAYHMGSFIGGVCTPSRHMIMTGRTVWHLPIGPGAREHCPPGIEQNSIPAVFNRVSCWIGATLSPFSGSTANTSRDRSPRARSCAAADCGWVVGMRRWRFRATDSSITCLPRQPRPACHR